MQSSSSSSQQHSTKNNNNDNNKLDSLPMDSCLQVLEYLKNHRQEWNNPMFEAIISTSKQLFYSKQEKKDFKEKRKQQRRENKLKKQHQQLNKSSPTMKRNKLKEMQVIKQHLSSSLSQKALLPPSLPSIDTKEVKEEEEELEESDEHISQRKCYVCKEKYDTMHHFYDRLCVPCGDFNFKKRSLTSDLTGHTALVTGGRIKIGFQIALKLLRNHCSQVIVTSRFPLDTLERFQKEFDFQIWKDRLCIIALDLRDINGVNECCQLIKEKVKKLDILINNAAQTIRRPIAFYETLIQKELTSTIPSEQLSFFPQLQQQQQQSLVKWNHLQHSFYKSVTMNQIPVILEQDLKPFELEIPRGAVDVNNQQIDLRSSNSWTLPLEQVSIPELLETQTINSTAPFILIQQLLPLMKKSTQNEQSFIINVSSMEGNFARQYKSHNHPHTNMAKASLNMLTRTSARQFALNYQIFMNAVDTGWVTEELPFGKMWFQRTVPLDEIDGAMRVLDPIFTKSTLFGQFLKDYKPYPW